MEPDTEASSGGRRAWLIAGALWLAMAAVTVLALWHLEREAQDSQARELRLLSLALTDGIDRGLRGADEGLQAMRAELHEGGLPVSGGEAARALHTRAGLMPLIQTLWLVDRDGHVLAASDATAAPDLSTFSPPLDQLAGDGAALSRPFTGGRKQEALLAMAIRFGDAPGTAGGWILAAMPVSELLGSFRAALQSADTRMWVVRGDGAMLASANARGTVPPDRSLASRPGTRWRRLQEGHESLVGLHDVPRYDVQVIVARDLAAVLRSWSQAAEVAGTALAVLLVIMAAAVHYVQLADRRRADAQRALRAQVARSGKLESLGTLAGSVAHDFNNVLAGIVGYGEMAQDAAAAGSDQARHLGQVLQAALRGKALVERILAFSRGGAHASTVFELEPVVEEVLALLSASLRPGIVLERVLQAHGARLRGDATQAFEAVMNLCTNAMQAMPDGGMLSVRLERLRVPEPRVLSHTALAAGDYLCLAVSDQGDGISPEVMEHLFEPFFTTRAAQSGTGLGLAVVFGVVAEFGGAIDVQSDPGRGACFTLYFPECKDAPEAVVPGAVQAPGGAGQRLMVVDDEPELVALAEEMLAGLGYDPVGYTDPALALQALGADPGAFAAVITDEVMPGLTGTQLTQALRRHAPRVPVLLVSGYGGALLAQRASAAGVNRVLAKPLQRANLSRALAELLA